MKVGKNMKRKNNQIVLCLSVVCVLSLLFMIYATTTAKQKKEFEPPLFDENAVSGLPQNPGDSWTRVYQEGMSFSAHVCGKVEIKNKMSDLFFTNDCENTVWMKLRIIDSDGNVIAETGLIRPNEYIKTVRFNSEVKSKQPIKIKIMSYEADTYYSMGSVTLNTFVE